MQRILVVAAAVGLLSTGCSSDNPVQVGDPTGSDDGGSSTTSSIRVDPWGKGDEPIPGTRPETAVVSLRPADALLRGEDVTGGWDEPSEGASPGYEIGPNQTDCDPYWVVESLAAFPVASRFWFRPGANLDHDVFETGRDTAAEVLGAADGLPVSCPQLMWLEGGSLTIRGLPVNVPDVVALELISDGGEVWWSALASRENVVSRLQWVHFGSPGEQPTGDAFREFEQLVAAMVDRLGEAPAEPNVVDPPVDDPPPDEPAVTLPPVTLPPTASTSATEPLPSDPDPIDGQALAGALLADADMPQGVSIDETLAYVPGDPEDQRIEGCDASEAVVAMDGWFALQRSFLPLDGGYEVLHLIGRASSVAEAESAVEMFGLIADCDPTLDEELRQAALDGGPLAGISGATATYLEVVDQGLFTVRFVAYQVGDVVGVVALGVEAGPLPPIDIHRGLTQSAIDRAAS